MYSRNSDTRWVRMNWTVPFQEIMKEYNSIKDSLIIHRPEDGHDQWFAMTLIGVDSTKTNSHWEYGTKTKKQITKLGVRCPKTIDWVNSLPYNRIDDVRFLVIKPGGYITEHVDVPEHNWLDPLNIAINYPTGSQFTLDGLTVPYDNGIPMVLNIHYPHSVENNSEQERVHLLVHGKKNKEFWNYAV